MKDVWHLSVLYFSEKSESNFWRTGFWHRSGGQEWCISSHLLMTLFRDFSGRGRGCAFCFIGSANDPFQIVFCSVHFVLSDLLMTSATQNPEMVFNLGEMQSGINQLLIGKWLFGSNLFIKSCAGINGSRRVLSCPWDGLWCIAVDPCCAILTDACDPFANVMLLDPWCIIIP